jgi:hypothetical protein
MKRRSSGVMRTLNDCRGTGLSMSRTFRPLACWNLGVVFLMRIEVANKTQVFFI